MCFRKVDYMSLKNRFLSVVLCVVILVISSGCEKNENSGLLPYDLEFGKTYEQIQKTIGVDNLKESSSNDGYVSELKKITNEEEIGEYLGTSDGVSDVRIMYAFNAEKVLYEIYYGFVVENEKSAEVQDIIIQKFNKIVGEEIEQNELSGPKAIWKNEKFVIEYSCEGATSLIIIHSFEYDFE